MLDEVAETGISFLRPANMPSHDMNVDCFGSSSACPWLLLLIGKEEESGDFKDSFLFVDQVNVSRPFCSLLKK